MLEGVGNYQLEKSKSTIRLHTFTLSKLQNKVGITINGTGKQSSHFLLKMKWRSEESVDAE